MDFGIVTHQNVVDCQVPVHAGELNNMVIQMQYHLGAKADTHQIML